MVKYSKSMLYQHETECYGCNNRTTNMSGMCDDCGGADDMTESIRPIRKAHTVSQAFNIIERGG